MRIAICGNYGTGKSTLAVELGKHFHCDSSNLAFADEVRLELAEKYWQVPVHKWWQKPTPEHIRNLLKGHGDLMRDLHGNDYWVLRLASHINQLGANSWTIGDMRFFHEAQWAKSMGSIIVYLGKHSTDYGLDCCWQMADIILPAKPSLAYVISAIENYSQQLEQIDNKV